MGIPGFLKVRIMLLHFYERPTLVPVFPNQKKSKEDFTFMNKGEAKIAFSICFVACW